MPPCRIDLGKVFNLQGSRLVVTRFALDTNEVTTETNEEVRCALFAIAACDGHDVVGTKLFEQGSHPVFDFDFGLHALTATSRELVSATGKTARRTALTNKLAILFLRLETASSAGSLLVFMGKSKTRRG